VYLEVAGTMKLHC